MNSAATLQTYFDQRTTFKSSTNTRTCGVNNKKTAPTKTTVMRHKRERGTKLQPRVTRQPDGSRVSKRCKVETRKVHKLQKKVHCHFSSKPTPTKSRFFFLYTPPCKLLSVGCRLLHLRRPCPLCLGGRNYPSRRTRKKLCLSA